jgi:hypothetical protein
MPNYFDFLVEILKPFVTHNYLLWTKNKADSWRLLDPSIETRNFSESIILLQNFATKIPGVS